MATCGVCNIAYGSTDETNHAGKLVWLYSSKQKHIQVWDCCNSPNTDLEKHNMVYTAEGLTITGKCAQCEAGGTVTMSVSGGTYTGYAFEATTEGTEDLGGWDAFEEPELTYCCEGGCKKAGTHTVTMTMGEASVSETFTITPKTLTIDTVYANDKSYDGSNKIGLRSIKLDGVVVYYAGQYDGEWDDDRDNVRIVEDEQLVMTVADSVPGYYETAAVTGIRLEGSDAGNYVIAESFDAVPLRNENGFEYTIQYRDVFVTIEDQNLVGMDAQVDQSKYILEGLPEQFTIEGIALYDNGMGQIDLDTSSVVIRLGDQDVTEHFYFRVSTGNLSYTCEGHSFNSNGFCATGQCDSYQPAEKYVELDEWGSEVVWYEISNAGQLYWVAEQVNVYHNGYLNARLMADITVNEDLTAENLRVWTPIGHLYAYYCGVFEGNGYTISGLYLKDPEMDYVGLFGYTSYNYPITDVHLTNSYFEGNSNVGGLFGNAGSNISGCSVSDTVTIKGNSNLGGIAGGSQFGELTNSYSLANIIPGEEGYDRGGLVGYNYMYISNCYTTDSVIVGGNNANYGGGFNNTFFLADTEDELEGTTAVTMEQFISGEVANLLQAGIQGEEIYDEETDSYITLEPEQIWGQTVGKGFPTQGGQKVYQVLNCKGEIGYSNTDKPLGHNFENGSCTVCGTKSDYMILSKDTTVSDLVLTSDLYVDLAGFDMTGTIITNGYKVYGMDSTTNSYTSEAIGYFNCVDENGQPIVPETHFKSDITGTIKRYMSISDKDGYSFHRFYLAITHMSLKPATTAVGYKAVFYGDDMVKENLESYGYSMALDGFTPKTVSKDASTFASGKAVTLRVDHYDVEQYGETELAASVMVKLHDGTVIESAACTMTMRGMVESLNDHYTDFSADQLQAVAQLIQKYTVMQTWSVGNLIASEG